MKKYIAELLGTFVLVFIGCGTVVFSAPFVGNIGVALAFGFALTVAAYTFGPISGAHVNPAVTLGFLASKRIRFVDALGYIIFQLAGAALASYVIIAIAKGRLIGYSIEMGLGQNGWGDNYAGRYNQTSAILFELIATFIFVKVVLKTTACDLKITGVVIGLTLAVIHILGLPITGVSVNPARSFGPAVFVQGQALQQLWLFLLVPSIAGILAGLCDLCCCRCCKCCGGQCKVEPTAPSEKPAVEHKAQAAERPVKSAERKPARRPYRGQNNKRS